MIFLKAVAKENADAAKAYDVLGNLPVSIMMAAMPACSLSLMGSWKKDVVELRLLLFCELPLLDMV